MGSLLTCPWNPSIVWDEDCRDMGKATGLQSKRIGRILPVLVVAWLALLWVAWTAPPEVKNAVQGFAATMFDASVSMFGLLIGGVSVCTSVLVMSPRSVLEKNAVLAARLDDFLGIYIISAAIDSLALVLVGVSMLINNSPLLLVGVSLFAVCICSATYSLILLRYVMSSLR